MKAVDFAEEFFDDRLVGFVGRQIEVRESVVGCLEATIHRARVVSFRRRGFDISELMLPECIDGLSLLDAEVGEVGVDPVGCGVAFLGCPVALLVG